MSGISTDSMNSDVPCANTATPSRNRANGMKKLRNPKSWKKSHTATRHAEPAVRAAVMTNRQTDITGSHRRAGGRSLDASGLDTEAG